MSPLYWGDQGDDLQDPDLTERELLHEDALDDADREYRHLPLAYVEAPSRRERRAHRVDHLANKDARAVCGCRASTTHGGTHE